MRTQRAAWCFVAPALLVISVFFFLPVLAAFVMKHGCLSKLQVTNFDRSLAQYSRMPATSLLSMKKIVVSSLARARCLSTSI